VQHQRGGMRHRAEDLHHRCARRTRWQVHVALQLPHSRAVDFCSITSAYAHAMLLNNVEENLE
jgi:hypothetical protein